MTSGSPFDWGGTKLDRPWTSMFREELLGAGELPPQASQVRLEDSPDKVFGWLTNYKGSELQKAVIIQRLDAMDFLRSYETVGEEIPQTELTLLTGEFSHAIADEDRLDAAVESDLFARGVVPFYASKHVEIATGNTVYRWRAIMVPTAAAEFIFDLEEFIPS